MKYRLGFLMILSLFVGLHAHGASLSCRGDESHMRVTVLPETGCPSGLVLLNVETACIDAASPAFSSLKAHKDYEFCYTLHLDPSGKTWLAYVMSAMEVR